MIEYADNTIYKGNEYFGPIKYAKFEQQIWTAYTYYKLEINLNDHDFTSNLFDRQNNVIIAKEWNPEYFLFLYNSIGKNYKWWYMKPPYITYEILQEYLSDKNKKYITLMNDGQPAGFAIINYYKDTNTPPGDNISSNLAYFGLMPHAIGKGLGLKFLNYCLLQAYYESNKMWLYTTSFDHPSAITVYKKAGFLITNTQLNTEYYPSII